MKPLFDLILDYERNLVSEETNLLHKWKQPIAHDYEKCKLEEYELLIRSANENRGSSHLTQDVIDDLFLRIVHMDRQRSDKTGSPPMGLSENQTVLRKKIIEARLSHYYDLLRTPGEFDTIKEVLKARYATPEEYLSAVEPIHNAETNMVAIASNAVDVSIIQARDSARRGLAESTYGRS